MAGKCLIGMACKEVDVLTPNSAKMGWLQKLINQLQEKINQTGHHIYLWRMLENGRKSRFDRGIPRLH